MSAQLTGIIQNLTAELDSCKRRLRQLEKENGKLRERLTAALTSAASQVTTSVARHAQGSASDTADEVGSPLRTPTNPAVLPLGATQSGEGSPSHRQLSAAPGLDFAWADHPTGSQTVEDIQCTPQYESALFRSTTTQHSRCKSYDPHTQLGMSFSSAASSQHGSTSTGTMVAALRRKVEGLERREASWREQVASLSRQLDTVRSEKDLQIHTMQGNLENLAMQLRDSQRDVQRLSCSTGNSSAPAAPGAKGSSKAPSQSLLGTSPGGGDALSVNNSFVSQAGGSFCTSFEGDGSKLGDDAAQQPKRRMQRSQTMIVLKKKPDSSGEKGELFAELPREELEDVFVTHANHVRTTSNNLVPISAITSGAAPLLRQPDGRGAAAVGGPGVLPAAVPSAPVNPNQLGDVLSEEPKDRRWYLYRVMRAALKKAMSNDRGFTSGLEGDHRGPVRPSVLPTLQGKSVSVVNMMVKEHYELHFYLRDNQVVMSDTAVSSLPSFHKQNSDPSLLQAFSSSSTGTTTEPGNAASPASSQGGNGSNAFSWLNARSDQVRVIFTGPTIFSYIRAYLRFDVDAFLRAVEEASWRESVSPGKSDASMFFFGNYVLKSVKESEYRFLKDVYIAVFAKYAETNPHTLVSKFFSLFSVYWLKKGTRRHFVVMNNVFWTKHYINKIYDIKGSSVGRDADTQGGGRTAFGALLLKDNDLPLQLIICGPLKRAALLAQLRSDTSFLASLSVVDYSCMIGIRTRVFTRENRLREQLQRATQGQSEDELFGFGAADGGILSLPIYAENDSSTVREDTYYIGLIDVLQTYTPQKRLEHFAKGLLMDKHTISVVPPAEFSERLCKVIERITV